MIQCVGKWRTKSDLSKLVGQHPERCDIVGKYMDDGERYSGLVSDIPYGRTVVAIHGYEYFAFSKGTNGKYKVE